MHAPHVYAMPMCVCMGARMGECMPMQVYLYVCACVCVFVCVYFCECSYVHVCIPAYAFETLSARRAKLDSVELGSGHVRRGPI